MRLPAGFLLRIAKATQSSDKKNRRMDIIIRQHYAQLEEELRNTFKGQKDVHIILDHRHGERRTGTKLISKDRRKADRRKPKDELVEVVIST